MRIIGRIVKKKIDIKFLKNRDNLKSVYKIDVAKFMLEVFEKWK